MRKVRALLLRLGGLLTGRRTVRDVDAELNGHIDLHIPYFVRAGMAEEEARRRALVALGGVAQTRERYRDRSRVQWIDDLTPDLKFAARVLIKERGFALVVRAAGDLTSLVPPLRKAVATVDPEQPVSAIRTMDDLLDSTIVGRRQQMTLLGVFASIAVLLASLGLYAVLAYGVAQRKQEIAVRMAVGATGKSVLETIAWDGQKLVLIGLAIGLAGAWATSRTMESLLRGVTPSDPLTYGVAGSVLWTIALIACAVPALRAARVNPATLLRGD